MMKILSSLGFLALFSSSAMAGLNGYDLNSVRSSEISGKVPSASVPRARRAARDVKDWTVIYYATTKDGLKYSFAQQLLELKAGGAGSNVNVAVEATFPVEDSAGAISTPTVRLAIGNAWTQAEAAQAAKNAVTSDKQLSASLLTALSGDIVSRENNTDSGDWRRVAAFVQWAKQNYPARHYAFVIYGHGNGFFDPKKTSSRGTLMDVETKDYVTLPEMRQMMAAAGHTDIFVMTSCIMQMAEVAWQVKDYTDVIVGSSELMWSSGYDLAGMVDTLRRSPSISSAQLGDQVAKSYVDGVTANKLKGGHASVMLTSRLPGLADKLNAWTDAVMALGDKTALAKGITGDVRFDIFGLTLATSPAVASRYSMSGDLYGFVSLVTENTPQDTPAQQLVRSTGRDLMNYIQGDLIYKYYYTGSSNTGYDFSLAHGISAHVPPVKILGGSWSAFAGYMQTDYWSLPFVTETRWGEFLKWAYANK